LRERRSDSLGASMLLLLLLLSMRSLRLFRDKVLDDDEEKRREKNFNSKLFSSSLFFLSSLILMLPSSSPFSPVEVFAWGAGSKGQVRIHSSQIYGPCHHSSRFSSSLTRRNVQLGLGDKKNRKRPEQISIPKKASPFQISVGGCHSAYVTGESSKID